MHDLSRCVSSNPLIGSIRDLLPRGTYLVGGCVRDMLLGRNPLDLDMVSTAPVETIARDISARIGSRPFWMDEKRGVVRIVVNGSSIDIARPKGADIGEDLLARDLTINAMAWDVSTDTFLDPAAGLDDLKNGVIRIISEKNLLDDPVRALRAVRFSVTLNFAIREETTRIIRKHRELLRQASPERVKLEISRSLDSVHSATFFRLLTWTGLMGVLFPPSLTGREGDSELWHPVFSTALPIAEEMDEMLYAAEALMPGSRACLEEETEQGVKRATMLRLAAFLMGLREARPAGESDPASFPGKAWDFCTALRFSSQSCRMVRGSLERLDSASELLSQDDPSTLDLYRFCREAAPVMPEVLLLSLALTRARGEVRRQTASEVWEYFRGVYSEYKEHPIISGNDVMEAVKGVSGPRVGAILAEVEEARARGLVRTRDEAIDFLHGIAS
ncbi:MAG TPA: hypothetical protein PKM41_10740 [Deltaproteobacteria bacterium]|jgi:tRNA nucleotidyltransferase/poly(A) polymerase|nr:hypothetical protein [Deltaproteobacteria bacterium]HOI06410.1 hypothetical protein [Deltaproteobacteria bacterium]